MNILRMFAPLAMLVALGAPVVAQQAVPPSQVKKPIVAVYELKDLAGTGQGEAFLQMVQTAITTTNRFRVIERNFAVLQAEQSHAATGMVTTNTPGRKGGFEGADFLIYGTITQAQGGQSTDAGCKLGMAILLGVNANCSRATATLSIDIRIVDSHTGQLRWAKQIRQDAQTKTSLAGDAAVDYVSLFRSAAQKIATGLTLALYPVKVAAVQPDGTVILNFGDDVLKVGDYMQIFGAEGNCIQDPDTHECLSSEGTVLGTVQIYATEARISRARAVEPFAQVPGVGAIARIYEPPPPPPKSKKRGSH